MVDYTSLFYSYFQDDIFGKISFEKSELMYKLLVIKMDKYMILNLN